MPDTAGLTGLAVVQAWAGAYLGMSGQLDKANGRTGDTLSIVRKCEALINEAR